MKSYKLIAQTFLSCLILGLFSFKSYSQNGIYFKWFSQVGCYEFSSEDNRIPLEDIGNDTCFKACENSESKYELVFEDDIDVGSIQWQVVGSVSYSSDFTSLFVTWGEGPANGAINITITLENGDIINKSICIDIINSPEASFEFSFDQIHNCSESPIYFINNSTVDPGDEIVSYQWDFGDGHTSSEFEPSHTYTQTGAFDVTLTVVNNCNCTSTFERTIEITGPAINIECPTVVCDGDTDVYTIFDIDNQCPNPTLNWSVDGGEIINSAGNDVEVLWNNVDEDGFGYIFFNYDGCDSDFCSSVITEKIPVIQNKGKIKGETNICQNEQYKYTLPQWPTTDFKWKLLNNTGQNFDNNLVLVDQRNQIVIDTENLPAGDYTLISDYINTLLGCGGNATLDLTVNKQAIIDGPKVVCVDDEILFEEISGSNNNLNWQIFLNGENYPVLDQADNKMLAVFEEPGLYHITVESTDLCPNENFVVEVKKKPNSPSGNIIGPDKVCKNNPIVFNYDGVINDEFFLVWEVEGGQIQGSTTGQEVTIIFDEVGVTNFQVSARFVDKDVPSCTSEPISLNVIEDPFPQDVIIQNLADESTFCPSTISSEFQLIEQSTGNPYDQGEVYEWYVEPVEFASIESGNLTNTVKVNFNEVNLDDNGDPITQGELKLQVKRCGVFHTVQSIPIHKYLFDLTIDTPDICRNDSFDIIVNSNIPINPNESGDIILEINDTNISDSPIFSINNQTITFQNMSLPANNVEQTQNVSVIFTTPNGCRDIRVTDSFDILETPVVETDLSGTITSCDDEAFNETFTASIISGGGSSNSYQWFENANPMPGETNPTLNISASVANVMSLDNNIYYVEVTNNDTGCSEVSDAITIDIDDCSVTPVCTFSEGSIDLDWTGCNTFTANAIGIPPNYTSLNWSISGPGPQSVASGQGTTNPTFSVSKIGTFTIRLRGEYPDCRLLLNETIVRGYKPRITTSISCNAANDGFEITLKDISDYFPGFEPTSDTEINFFLNGSPISNNPTNFEVSQSVALPPGSGQQVSVEIQQANMPLCVATKTFDVPNFPDANFSLTSPQCTENAFLLSPDAPINNDFSYTWSFLGTQNLQPQHFISMPPADDNLIELTVTGNPPFDCSVTTTLNIEVDEADFSDGDILGGGTFCNNLTTLNYSNLNPSQNPSAYQWMQGNEVIPGATASSYQPTESGSYWVQLFNANGCVDDSDPVNVTYVTPPEANVDAPLTACVNQDFSLQGFVLPQGVEYQWDIDGNPTGWSTDFPAQLSQNFSSTGTVDYIFQVRLIDNPSCMTEIGFQVDIVQPASINVVQVQENCNPYTVTLKALGGDSNGVYNWSNGSINNPVQVSHGGPYRLTYIPPNGGCETVVDINVPKSPDEFIWIFPEGCFEYCRNENPFLIGPIPTMGAYEWIDDGIIVDADNDTQVPELNINDGTSDRNLQLSLSNNGCTVTSELLDVEVVNCDENCQPTEFNIRNVTHFSDPFEFYEINASIFNNYNQLTTFTFIEANGEGVFIPSNVTINPGQTSLLNPLTFIPNANFNGVSININIKHQQAGDIICQSEHSLSLPGESLAKSQVYIKSVSPNPFIQDLKVDVFIPSNKNYNTLQLKVFDIQGRKYIEHKVDTSQDYQNLNALNLPLGQFIMVLEEDGQIIDQKHLIKD